MTDYTQAVGTAGTMIIRDNGSTVEFLISCSDGATHNSAYGWSGTVNGVGVGGTANLTAGFGTRSLGIWTVSYSQQVHFHQNATGTQGLGGAADLYANISRATVPATPAPPTASAIGTTQMTLNWSIPSNGGASIDQMLLRRNGVTPVDSAGYADYAYGGGVTSATPTQLLPGQKYYWCVYAHNSVGYSFKSGDTYAPTLPVAPTTPTFSGVGTTGLTVAWTAGSNGNALTGYDLQWATDAAFTQNVGSVSLTGISQAVTGLLPGKLYYWRVRAKTASGPGAYSATATQATALDAPTNLAFSGVIPTGTTLSWTAVSGAAGYNIQYSTDPGFATSTTVTSTTNTVDITGLTPNTVYYFRVQATTPDVNGPFSAPSTQTTLPSTAPGLTMAAAADGRSATATMSPPGGATGVTKYTIEYQLVPGGTSTLVDSPTTSLVVTGLTPGATYQWRATAWFGTYQSPASTWQSLTQPSPNTNPGDYFDGSTPSKPDTSYGWTGTANLSRSQATGVGVAGWEVTGAAGTSLMQRVTGGFVGTYAARAVILVDAAGAGVYVARMINAAASGAAVSEGGTYVGSAYVRPSRAQSMRAELIWMDSSGAPIGATAVGAAVNVTDTAGWTRLSVSGAAPSGVARAILRVTDATGTGWSAWRGGQYFDVDAAMVTLASLFPYFDGNTPDTTSYDYAWLGVPDASASARNEYVVSPIDPLADPDCAPLPTPPLLPTISSECIDETGTWRRYSVNVPASQVRQWSSTLPTLILSTGPTAVKQVRIRYYENPQGLPVDQATTGTYDSEMIVTYIPPNTQMTLDAVTEQVTAVVPGTPGTVSGNRLLYGTGGVPATWPELRCGIGYVIALDVPLDAPSGNLSTRLVLTQRL